MRPEDVRGYEVLQTRQQRLIFRHIVRWMSGAPYTVLSVAHNPNGAGMGYTHMYGDRRPCQRFIVYYHYDHGGVLYMGHFYFSDYASSRTDGSSLETILKYQEGMYEENR